MIKLLPLIMAMNLFCCSASIQWRFGEETKPILCQKKTKDIIPPNSNRLFGLEE